MVDWLIELLILFSNNILSCWCDRFLSYLVINLSFMLLCCLFNYLVYLIRFIIYF